MKTKIACALMAVLMVAGIFTACSNPSDIEGSNAANPSVTASETVSEVA